MKFQSNIYPFNVDLISLKYHLISINFDTDDIHLRSFKIPFLSNLNIQQRGKFPSPSTLASSSCMKASLTFERSSLVKDHASAKFWRLTRARCRVGSNKTKAQVEGQFLLFWMEHILWGGEGFNILWFCFDSEGMSASHANRSDRTSWHRVPDHHRKARSAEGGGIAKVHQGIHLILQGHGTHGYPWVPMGTLQQTKITNYGNPVMVEFP